MRIEDYKNVVNRMHIKHKLEDEIIDSIAEKNKNNKKSFIKVDLNESIIVPIVSSKKVISPIARLTFIAICLSTFTLIFVAMDIFKKTNNFETKTDVEKSINEEIVCETKKSIIIPKVTFRKWSISALKEIFSKNASDDCSIQYGDGDIRWEYSDWYDYSYGTPTFSFLYRYYGKTNDDVVLKEREISGLDKSECIALADFYIEELNISVKSKQVYALDLEFLIKSDTARNENGERVDHSGEVLPEWTENQEAYLIVYTPCVDNIPLSQNNNQINVVVGRNGLAYFEADGIYETLDIVETVEICSAKEAVNAVYEYFNKELTIGPINENECRLIYLPEQLEEETYILKPYWQYNFAEFSAFLNSDNESYDDLFIDAQTGRLRDH